MVDEAGRNNGKEYQHQVIISKNFYLGAYEITQAQYYSIMGVYPSEHDGSKIGESRDNLPVELVSYDDIVAPTDGFLAKLNKHFKDTNQLPTGYKFDLPTEAQWEYLGMVQRLVAKQLLHRLRLLYRPTRS